MASNVEGEYIKNKVYNNFQAALTERTSSYDRNKPEKCGIPTERLVNLYTKWGHGGFGLIFTGNIVVDYVRKFLKKFHAKKFLEAFGVGWKCYN